MCSSDLLVLSNQHDAYGHTHTEHGVSSKNVIVGKTPLTGGGGGGGLRRHRFAAGEQGKSMLRRSADAPIVVYICLGHDSPDIESSASWSRGL